MRYAILYGVLGTVLLAGVGHASNATVTAEQIRAEANAREMVRAAQDEVKAIRAQNEGRIHSLEAENERLRDQLSRCKQ